jgi:hypothetical protein
VDALGPEVRPARGIAPDRIAQPLELAAADVGEARARRVTPSMGTNGPTSDAPSRGCWPEWWFRSISVDALAMARNAASTTGSGSPANVTTERLWSGSISRSSSVTPGTAAMLSRIWSTTSRRRPSEKFGTHSTSRGISHSWTFGSWTGLAACGAAHGNASFRPTANPAP